MKILLLNSPREGESIDFLTPAYITQDFMKYPPLGLMAVAAGIGKRHETRILDVDVKGMTVSDTAQYVCENPPDVLGISIVTKRLFPAYELTRIIKERAPKVIILAGGPHVNAFPLETMGLGTVDFAVTGYCENKISPLLDAIEQGKDIAMLRAIPNLFYKDNENRVCSTAAVEDPLDLDDLPFPAREMIDLNDYYTAADRNKITTMFTSRGCPYRCIYCDVQEKTYHSKSPGKIIDEIKHIVSLGINEIHFFEDTFNISKERVLSVCRRIVDNDLKIKWSARIRAFPLDAETAEAMKKAGCVRLHIGVESMDEKVLEYMKKGVSLHHIRNAFEVCRNAGIDTLAYFILGFPQETDEYRRSLLNTILKELKPTYVYFNILTPLPNTEYYRDLLAAGGIAHDKWKDFISKPVRDFTAPYPGTKEDLRKIIRLVDRFHREFFFNPAFILKEAIASLKSPATILRKTRAAFQMLKKMILTAA